MIIDGQGSVMGRLASKVSKELLRGTQVIVINADKIVISGNPHAIIERYKEKLDKGSAHKGPFYPKYPDKLFRRVVRGMLPFKNDRGRKAYRKLRVYIGNPDNITGEKLSKDVSELKSKYLTLQQLGRRLGAKID